MEEEGMIDHSPAHQSGDTNDHSEANLRQNSILVPEGPPTNADTEVSPSLNSSDTSEDAPKYADTGADPLQNPTERSLRNDDIAQDADEGPTPNDRNLRNLRLDTVAAFDLDVTAKSDTSSVVPTSARLSIATTTHPFVNAPSNAESIGAMLDGILANPGWSAAAGEGSRRRNSLFSMRSLNPTLPPYEEYRNHATVHNTEVGPSDLRRQNAPSMRAMDEKRRDHDDDNGNTNADSGHTDNEVDPVNALSAHYSSIVRTLDQRYTVELARLNQEMEKVKADHEREIAQMRNDIDASYRKVLRARNQEVERVREEAAADAAKFEERIEGVKRLAAETEDELKTSHARKMERARHEVEDVWERRWRDRMELVDEEGVRRLEERVEEGVKDRDEEWLHFLRRECPDVLERARTTMVSSGDIPP